MFSIISQTNRRREYNLNTNIRVLALAQLFKSSAALAATHPPVGYLVPSSDSIPSALHQIQWFYPPYSGDSYVLEYKGPDNQASLAITENPVDPKMSFEQQMKGYDEQVKHPTGNVQTTKVADIERLGARGTLFRQLIVGVYRYDLLLDDNRRLFRLQAQDGPKFQFTEQMVMNIVDHLSRQQ